MPLADLCRGDRAEQLGEHVQFADGHAVTAQRFRNPQQHHLVGLQQRLGDVGQRHLRQPVPHGPGQFVGGRLRLQVPGGADDGVVALDEPGDQFRLQPGRQFGVAVEHDGRVDAVGGEFPDRLRRGRRCQPGRQQGGQQAARGQRLPPRDWARSAHGVPSPAAGRRANSGTTAGGLCHCSTFWYSVTRLSPTPCRLR